MQQSSLKQLADRWMTGARNGRATVEEWLEHHPAERQKLERAVQFAAQAAPLAVSAGAARQAAALGGFVSSLRGKPDAKRGWFTSFMEMAAPPTASRLRLTGSLALLAAIVAVAGGRALLGSSRHKADQPALRAM